MSDRFECVRFQSRVFQQNRPERDRALSDRTWPASDTRHAPSLAGSQRLDFRLFGHLQRVMHLNPQVPDDALELGTPEQQLHCPADRR